MANICNNRPNKLYIYYIQLYIHISDRSDGVFWHKEINIQTINKTWLSLSIKAMCMCEIWNVRMYIHIKSENLTLLLFKLKLVFLTLNSMINSISLFNSLSLLLYPFTYRISLNMLVRTVLVLPANNYRLH